MPETTETMRNKLFLHMKEDIHEGGHRVVLRTADAYAARLNALINNSMTGYDTVIYRNK